MGEFRREIKTYQVDYSCDKCGRGMMRPTGTVLTSYPALYPHICNVCGNESNYQRTYPYQSYEYVK